MYIDYCNPGLKSLGGVEYRLMDINIMMDWIVSMFIYFPRFCGAGVAGPSGVTYA
jgi:hypothetical protein